MQDTKEAWQPNQGCLVVLGFKHMTVCYLYLWHEAITTEPLKLAQPACIDSIQSFTGINSVL